MAPEIRLWNPQERVREKEEKKQNKKAPYNPFKADIFSFGIFLCEMVANTFNFEKKNLLGKLKGHKFEKVILECLKENPSARPNTKELLQFFKH